MRPDRDTYFINLARLVATRSTCIRRAVGCVLVDEHHRVLATGHNGNPPGMPHCVDHPCAGSGCPSGQGLDLCEATHAEINALLFCPDVMKIRTVYCTLSPCLSCVKALMTTGATHLVFADQYAEAHSRALDLWVQSDRKWTCLNAK